MKVNTTYEPYAQEPEYIEANRALLQSLDLAKVHRVLDLACGTGLLSDLLLQLKPGLAINGVDLSAESLDIGRRQFREKNMLVETQSALDAAAKAGRSAMLMTQGSAMDLTFGDNSFDAAMMGNAIHLMPDKDDFLAGVARVLKPGCPFTFNSVFFTGTFEEGSEPVYTEWMKGALVMLNKKNDERVAAGKKPFKRERGRFGKAFSKGWMTPEQWGEKLEQQGLSVTRTYKRPISITARGLALVGAYGGLAEVLMSGYPVDVASECLQEAAAPAFELLGLTEVTRYWLEMSAVKVGA